MVHQLNNFLLILFLQIINTILFSRAGTNFRKGAESMSLIPINLYYLSLSMFTMILSSIILQYVLYHRYG